MRILLLISLIALNLACAKKGYLDPGPGGSLEFTSEGGNPNLPPPPIDPVIVTGPLNFSESSITLFSVLDVVYLPQYILDGVAPYIFTVVSTEPIAYVLEDGQFLALDPGTIVFNVRDAEGKEGEITVTTLQ